MSQACEGGMLLAQSIPLPRSPQIKTEYTTQNLRITLMKKKQVAFSVLLIHVLSLLAFAQTATRPNVLLVLSDDHSAAHVGAYGNADIKTPNLDLCQRRDAFQARLCCRTPMCSIESCADDGTFARRHSNDAVFCAAA